MTQTAALKFLSQIENVTGLPFDRGDFVGIAGVSRGTKGFRKGLNVFVAVFYGGKDPGIRVTIQDKLKRFELGTDVDVVGAYILDRVVTPKNAP